MYIPYKYREENPERIREFLNKNAFGILVSSGPNGPMTTHLPMELNNAEQSGWILEGHFAKANPQWREIKEGQEVLCIFNGPHAYVSSSWYQDEEVPTWNYQAVHIRGTYKQMSLDQVMQALDRMVKKYESASENPISLDKLSPETLAQVQGIVGFQIESLQIEAAFKLSQGREKDHLKIRDELHRRGGLDAAVAHAMEKNSQSTI